MIFAHRIRLAVIFSILLFSSGWAPSPALADLNLAWTLEGGYNEAVLGSDAHTAGDVNGDGYDDLILAAPGVGSEQGVVSVFHGSASGITTPAAWTHSGSTTHYGTHVSTAGDINGDGFDDILIGTTSYQNGQQGEGQVELFLGSAGGLAAASVWDFESDDLLAGLGPCAFAGDVNDDGLSDFIVAAPAFALGKGKVWVFRGDVSGTPAFLWSAASGLFERLGTDVSTAGDTNGDGRSDIVLGTGFGGERALVGISDAVTTFNLTVINSPSVVAAAQFGASVCTFGDIDGDGYSDVGIGAPKDSTDQWEEGKAYLFRGTAGGINTVPSWEFESDVADAEFGSNVSPAGDVNGDGFGDALIAAPRLTNGDNFEGAIWVFNGNASTLDSTPHLYFESNASPGLLGRGLSCAGDVNGDGYSDIVAGALAFEETAEFDEGKVWLWHGGPDMPSHAVYVQEENQEGAHHGASVAFGDFNGDGFSDRVFGAPLYDFGGVANRGLVTVTEGGPGTPNFVPLLDLSFQARPDEFGTSVCGAHDVNGDGYDELIVGGPKTQDGAGTALGAAHVYFGDPTFPYLSNASLTTLWGTQAGADYGHSVSWAGDVNGDGFSDVIVGAPLFDNGATDEGAVFVYLGTSGGINTTPVWTWEGGVDGALFGWSVGVLGDANRDGFSDVIVGAPGHTGAGESGRAYVFFGDAAGISAAAPWTVSTPEVDEFGFAVFGCDANGDGYSDAWIGAPGWDGGGGIGNRGRASVYLSDGAGLSGTPAVTIASPGPGFRLGEALSAADFDQDGTDELVVGVPRASIITAEEGQIGIYDISGALLWTANGNSPAARLGSAVASRGDTNGDGFPDILGGAPFYESPFVEEGRAFTWIGNGAADQSLSPGLRRTAVQAKFDGSRPLGLLGDNDNDPTMLLRSDVRSPMGRDDVRLEVEVKPYGTAFDGSGLLVTTFGDTQAPGSYGSTAHRFVSVPGIAMGERYHWRMRHVSRHPYATAPWFSPAGNAWGEFDFRRTGFVTGVPAVAFGPSSLRLSARPVPFRESTLIEFELRTASSVALNVYSVTGRHVRSLSVGSRPAGRHSVTWNGSNEAGERVAAGVYFVVMDTPDELESRRVVMLR